MAVGPGRPEEGDLLAGGDGDVRFAVGGALVADDVGGLVGVRGHEADVEVAVCPACDGRGRVHIWECGRVVAGVVCVADFDLGDVAMRSDLSRKSAYEGGDGENSHVASERSWNE